MAEPVRAKPLFSQNGVIYEAIIRVVTQYGEVSGVR